MSITSDASGNDAPTSIRLATERDAEQIATIYASNVTDTIVSFELEPPSADEMRRRVEVTLERYPWLVCERQGRVLGYAYAGATLPNPASVGLHDAMGFRPVGVYRGVGYKMGAWHDVAWWHLLLRERVADPDPPANLPSVLGSEEWDAALKRGLLLLRSDP